MHPRRLFFLRLSCVPPSLLFAAGWTFCGLGVALAAEPPAAASGYLRPVEGCLSNARDVADEAVARLYHHGLFRGHPGKPYYEAMDGVGQLLYALLGLDRVLADPRQALSRKAIPLHGQAQAVNLPADNW